MTFKQQNRIIILSYIISIVLNPIVMLIKDIPQAGVFANSIKITTLLTLWWLFYFYYGWRIPYLRKILFRMNFNGTWVGEFKSVSADKKELSGEIALRIKQDYLTISVISLTKKYQNFSYSELVKFEEKSNVFGINYTYSQQENNLFDTSQRNGTSELTLKLVEDEPWLEGKFWTIHGSQGTLKVKRITEKQIDTFNEAVKIAKG